MMRYCWPLLAFLGASGAASADYILTPLCQGANSVEIEPGDTFTVDLVLTSEDASEHISAIFRVEFSLPGLIYKSYEWNSPYSTGTVDDESVPKSLDLPIVLTADLVAGPGYPNDAVDLELSNVTDYGMFETGRIASLTLAVPSDAQDANVTVSVVPGVFDDGFSEVTAAPGNNLLVVIVPEPGGLALLAVLGTIVLSRWRKHASGASLHGCRASP